ncbi:MAG: DNA topoisomerase IB [Polyangiales bacterium]
MPVAAVASPTRALADPVIAAKHAGLRYVSDQKPGIRRRRSGKSFRYVGVDGKAVRDDATLARIRALAVPPAWSEVWICPDASGHIQATGRDVKGRKQYRYHARFRAVRDETKYDKIFDFASALPRIRARCERDLQKPGLSREKVLAAVVCLLEQTLIRVGNEEYSRLNQSFGLTTLRDGHARIRGAQVTFHFRGKSGIEHSVAISDRRLARIVKRCRDLPGDELFQYLDDDGARRTIDSSDVNTYLREVAGDDFTAKDFRTFAGTVLAALALAEAGPCGSQTAAKKQIVGALKEAAARLGNTPAVCRKCYVHPGIFEAYLRGRVVPKVTLAGAKVRAALRGEEKAVLAFLRRHLTEAKREAQPGGLVRLLEKSVRKVQPRVAGRRPTSMRRAAAAR